MTFLLLLNCILNFSFQEEPKVQFVIESRKSEVIEGECVTVTVSLLIDDEDPVDLRFPKDLGYQLAQINSSLSEGKWFYHNNLISNIVREYYEKKGVIYTKYKLIEMALCPYDSADIFFPPMNLSLIKNQSKSIQLKSEPLRVKVKPLEDVKVYSNLYSNHFYNMVGDYALDEELDNGEVNYTGDTIGYKIRIYGEGNSFPIGLNAIDTSSFQIIIDSVFRNDTIIRRKLRAEKTWKLKMIPKKAVSDYPLSKVFEWKYYSLKEEKVVTLRSKESIWVKESNFQNAITPSQNINRVIAIDVSKTMLIEDYQPSRIMRAIEIANAITKDSCDAKFLIFAGDVKGVDSCRIETNPYNFASQKIGTAIGNAIWEAIQVLEAFSGEREIIIIGDGDETAGSISGIQVANLARTLGIKVHCIGIGTMGLVPFYDDEHNKIGMVDNTFRSDLFLEIAAISRGQYIYLRPQQGVNEIIEKLK